MVASLLFVINGESAFVESGELRLWTERVGRMGDPVVLLIMGTSAQGIGWPDELVKVLADGGRQVIRFDHRDTGQSDSVDFAAAPYTIGDMAGDALAVLDGCQVRTAGARFAAVPGIGHGFFSPGIPARIAELILDHTGA